MKPAGALIAAGLWAASAAAGAQSVAYGALERLAPGPSACPGGLCQADALSAVFRRLAGAGAGAGEPVPAVHIRQIGDSHTAGGRITGAVRTRLQARFGHAPAPAGPAVEGHGERRPGVLFFESGRVGATLHHLPEWPDDEVAGGPPPGAADLVILAFGTNEGFEDALDAAAYEALLRSQVDRLRRLTPAPSLLILGAPDALRSGVEAGCSADGRRAPPPSLAVVRDVQRRVAADLGVAFWDWHGRMGGDCSADRLASRAEPLMHGDGVHFTGAGADWIGGVLADDLIAAYEVWKAGPGGAD